MERKTKETKVLFAASEAVPFAKTGGLADVAGSLPQALAKQGVDIRVVMPKYRAISRQYTEKMEFLGNIFFHIGWRNQYCGIYRLVWNGVVYYFIDNAYYFDRDGLYGHGDEGEQFTFFSRALLEILPFIGFKPGIIHCNDWQTAIVSLLLKDRYAHQDFYRDMRTVYTIHNLKYQGIFPKSILKELMDLSWDYFTTEGVEFHDQVNFMKAGLVYSDIITTVSKTYAEEIKYDFFGENLAGITRKRAKDLYGIVNGIDFEENNPATDGRLFATYDADNLEGKYTNKKMLQESLGLPVNRDIPVIGIISRLVDQKGFDLIACVLNEILQENLQLIVLGSGDYRYESMFNWAAHTYPQKLSSNMKYDAVLAQRIYAGSDMFLMPSLFEPCGLSQLFSLRYGTIPIVRETGGLKDTIASYDEYTGEGNGFSFSNYNAHDMLHTIRRALHFYYDTSVWNSLIKRGMKQNFSWEKSAGEYLEIYGKLMG